MTLASGTRLGPYEIRAPLGAGGMGEVYRATDTRLGREVAIKVLPQAVAADPERLARFEREAKVLASLNHPAIAAIYGVEESGPAKALVMELVEGPTLSDRLLSGPLALEEALRAARQIAAALEAAHDKGIVHRDLKPANVKVTADGDVKVLDFGLAKALDAPGSSDLAQSPTITAMATQHGVILGTAAYMSPEQARGGAVDKRADIWAFGCVLYEMLTGRRPFAEDTVSDTLAAVLRAEVDWSALPPSTPPALRRLLGRCLEKDRKLRLHDIGDAQFELEEAARPLASVVAAADPTIALLRRRARWGWIAAAAAGAVAVVAVALATRSAPRPGIAPRSVTRFSIVDPPLARFVGYPRLAVAPDGSRLFFAAERDGLRQLYVRPLDRLEATPVPGTEGLAGVVAVSPDGDRVAFVRGQELLAVSMRGGNPLVLMRALNFRGGSWGDDEILWYTLSTEYGLYRAAADGRELGPAVAPDPAKEERSLRWPWVLPGGQAVLYQVGTAAMSSFDEAPLEAFDLANQKRTPLGERGNHPAFLPPSTLLFVRDGTLMAAPFDARRLTLAGAPVPVESGVMMDPSNGAVDLAVAGDGTIAYTAGRPLRFERRLMWFDRQGRSGLLAAEAAGFQGLDVAPDGSAILVDLDAANANIWRLDLDGGGTLVRLTHKWSNNQAIWTPDGKHMIYTSARGGEYHLWREPVDGSGEPEKLLSNPWPLFAHDVSPDGSTLLFTVATDLQEDLLTLPLAGGGEPRAWSATRYVEDEGVFSPDGRWIAYQSNESGRPEVYIGPYPGPGAKTRVSREGGIHPIWSRDGRELFFLEGPLEASRMKAAGVETAGGRLMVSAPVALFETAAAAGSYIASRAGKSFDVLPDGRFAMIMNPAPAADPEPIVVIRNWSPATAPPR